MSSWYSTIVADWKMDRPPHPHGSTHLGFMTDFYYVLFLLEFWCKLSVELDCSSTFPNLVLIFRT